MSRRITVSTEMTDNQALERVCRDKAWAHEVQGHQFQITSGPLGGCRVNVRTGEFQGDTDYASPEVMTGFVQMYGEALWMNRIEATGILESREVQQDGTVTLIASVMVA